MNPTVSSNRILLDKLDSKDNQNLNVEVSSLWKKRDLRKSRNRLAQVAEMESGLNGSELNRLMSPCSFN